LKFEFLGRFLFLGETMGNNPARQKGEGRSSGIVKEGLVIQLDGRRLTEIPASIFDEEEERQKLGTGEITTGLILNFNHLSSIPPKLATTFLYLTELALAANRLASLPSEIWVKNATLPPQTPPYAKPLKSNKGLTSLVYLHLGVNKLTTISEDIGCLLALKDLNLASNKLTEMPNSLQRLSALCQLTLTGNLLTHCPSKLPQNLKVLLSSWYCGVAFNLVLSIDTTTGHKLPLGISNGGDILTCTLTHRVGPM